MAFKKTEFCIISTYSLPMQEYCLMQLLKLQGIPKIYTTYLHQQTSTCINTIKSNLLPNKSKLQNVKISVVSTGVELLQDLK